MKPHDGRWAIWPRPLQSDLRWPTDSGRGKIPEGSIDGRSKARGTIEVGDAVGGALRPEVAAELDHFARHGQDVLVRVVLEPVVGSAGEASNLAKLFLGRHAGVAD